MVFLQALFPRVCPVCGELLKLPKNWHALLLRETMDNSLSGESEFSNIISDCRSIFICPECYPSLSFIEEHVCRKCSKPLVFDDERLCKTCQKGNLHFDQGKALWIHEDAARKMIYALKFQNKRDNADLIGFEMALRMKDLIILWKAEVLIPVPLHKKRLRERGFNQAQLIAENISFWLSKIFGITIPVDSEYLLRSENTKPQRILDASARSQNVKKAFTINEKNIRSTKSPAIRNSNIFRSKQAAQLQEANSLRHYHSVVLVDDIFTSGATINACAKTLKRSGIKEVFFLTATTV